MQSRTANACLLLLSLGASLGAAELLARQLYTPPLAIEDERFVPFAETALFTPPLNALGFRELPPGPDGTDPGVRRILVLGDSFTFGDGVRRGEDRFTDLIEARLNREAGSGERYHVYNAGVSGSRPAGWLRDFRKLRPSYRADLVLAVFFLRDGTDLCTSLRCHVQTIRAIKARYAERFGQGWSYLAKLFYGWRIRSDFAEEFRGQVVRAYLGSEAERATWTTQSAALRALAERVQRSGSELHLVVFPMLLDLDDYPFQAVEDEILRVAREAGIPAISLLDGFRGQDARALWVAANDQHPNERGHRIAANTLYPYVRDTLRKEP